MAQVMVLPSRPASFHARADVCNHKRSPNEISLLLYSTNKSSFRIRNVYNTFYTCVCVCLCCGSMKLMVVTRDKPLLIKHCLLLTRAGGMDITRSINSP